MAYQFLRSLVALVTPQAMDSLKPLITPNAPGRVAPLTEYSGVVSCMAYHKEGMFSPRWGSLANMALPLRVFFPDTAQLLEPMPGSGTGRGSTNSVESG